MDTADRTVVFVLGFFCVEVDFFFKGSYRHKTKNNQPGQNIQLLEHQVPQVDLSA